MRTIKQLLTVALLATSFGAFADDLLTDTDWANYQVPFANQVTQQTQDWSEWDDETTANYINYVTDFAMTRDNHATRAELEASGFNLFGYYDDDYERYVSPIEEDFVNSAAFLVNAKIYKVARDHNQGGRAIRATNKSGAALRKYADERGAWDAINGYEKGFYGEVTQSARVQAWLPQKYCAKSWCE